MNANGMVEGSRVLLSESTVVIRWSAVRARLRSRRISYRVALVPMDAFKGAVSAALESAVAARCAGLVLLGAQGQ